MTVKPVRITRRLAAVLALITLSACPAAAQSATGEHESLLSTLSGGGNPVFFRTIAVDFVQNFVDRHYADNPDAKRDWTNADTQKAVDLYYAPVLKELDRRVSAQFAGGLPLATAQQLNGALVSEPARATMTCALKTIAADRTPKVWAECERANGARFSTVERDKLGQAQAAYEAAIVQPLVNGALGGTVCHALGSFAKHLSKDGTTYTFGATVALGDGEAPKRCDVNKARWAALIGIDAFLQMEPQIVFEKTED